MPDDESESTIVDNVVFTVPEPGEATDEYDPSEYEISG
jgi:hypothetical protein